MTQLLSVAACRRPLFWKTARVIACCAFLWGSAARADVSASERPTEDTAFTLRAKEWKVGLVGSGYGVTDWLEVDSQLLLDLASFANAGLKARIYKDAGLAVAVEAFGGYLGLGQLTRYRAKAWDAGGKAELSVAVAPRVYLHLLVGAHSWAGSLDLGSAGYHGQLTWVDVKGQVEWDVTSRHLLFFTAQTPTGWIAQFGNLPETFDATDFWEVLAGYQLSLKHFNLRVDLGYGPSLLGRGLTGSLDAYFRF